MTRIMKLNVAVIAVVLGLTSAFSFGLLMPGFAKLKEARAEVAVEAEKTRTEQQQVGDVSKLFASIMELDEQMRDFRSRLPADRDFGDFLRDLSNNLLQAGVENYAVQPRPAREVDPARLPPALAQTQGTTILPVSISFESGFSQVFDFLAKIEAMPRLTHVETISLANNEQSPGDVKVEIMLYTYHHP